MGLDDQEPHPVEQVSAGAVVGICVGGLVFLVSLSVCFFRCYRRFSFRHHQSDYTSSAFRRGSAKKEFSSQSLRSSASIHSSSSLSLKSPVLSSQRLEPMVPDRRLSPTTQGSTLDLDPKHIKSEYLAIECEKADKTPENDEKTFEKGVEEKQQTPDKLGCLYFNAEYDQDKTTLVVTVLRACDLPAKDSNMVSADPYIKLQLLPEKKHKVKTRVLRKTLNPIYDEIFTFYGISPNQLQGTTLHFVVLSFDRYSRDEIIGEVLHPLAGSDLSKHEVAICKEIMPRHHRILTQGRGDLLVSLCYQPVANRLTVVVLKARNLPKMDVSGLSGTYPYVKIYLLFDGQRIAKKKTHVKKRTLNPVFNESFLFDVPCNEGLKNIGLEFHVLDWDRVTKNEVIGRVELGVQTTGDELRHWNEVVNCPRKQFAEWHKLKE